MATTGYLDSTKNIQIKSQPAQQLQLMLTAVEKIENVIVTASRYELSSELTGSQYTLTRAQIENAPTLGDDAIRAVNTLPGSAHRFFIPSQGTRWGG